MKLIIPENMENYNFSISVAHISIAKFGWLHGTCAQLCA